MSLGVWSGTASVAIEFKALEYPTKLLGQTPEAHFSQHRSGFFADGFEAAVVVDALDGSEAPGPSMLDPDRDGGPLAINTIWQVKAHGM